MSISTAPKLPNPITLKCWLVKFEDALPAKKPKLEVTVVKEEPSEQSEQPRGSPMDLTTAMQMFSNAGETSFKDCSFNINISK